MTDTKLTVPTERKSILKDVSITPMGLVQAVFVSYDLVDHDGDLVLRSAIKPGPCVISGWNHSSWQPGQLPAGHGEIRSTAKEGILDGQFLMTSIVGRETFETVRALSDVGLMEWSWSLRNIVSTTRPDGVRVISGVDVREVSPVLSAASINTRTLSAKDTAVLERARQHIDVFRAQQARDMNDLATIHQGLIRAEQLAWQREMAHSRAILEGMR
jgi:hypothetical protein